MPIQSINPQNGTPIKEDPELTVNKISPLSDKSCQVFEGWKRLLLKDRIECFRNLAMIVRTKALDYGELMENEMGKPIDQGIREAEKCAWCCEYYVQNAPSILKDELVSTEAQSSFITYQPLGVILAIMPSHFSFWQVFRAAVPALMAGNAMLLKHSSLVPGCALKIERIFQEAGFSEGLFRSLLIENNKASAVISEKDEAKAIRMANDSPFGLGAAVFTKDIERGRRIARDELDTGSCFVNDFVKSDLRLPFGGIKQSGYGRELSSFGIHKFVNIKTVVIK